MRMNATEKATQSACLQLLEAKGIMCWRNNTGAFKGEGGGFYRFGAKGSPDILAILPDQGKFLGIECKDVRGKLSEDQENFKFSVEMMGGIYLVARSIDDLISFLKRYYGK